MSQNNMYQSTNAEQAAEMLNIGWNAEFFNTPIREEEKIEVLHTKLKEYQQKINNLLDQIHKTQQAEKEGSINQVTSAWLTNLKQDYPYINKIKIDDSVTEITINVPFKLRYRGDSPFHMSIPNYQFTLNFTSNLFWFQQITCSCFPFSEALITNMKNDSKVNNLDRFIFYPHMHLHAAGGATTPPNRVSTSAGSKGSPFNVICTGPHNSFNTAFQNGNNTTLPAMYQAIYGALRWVETINVNDTYRTDLIKPKHCIETHFAAKDTSQLSMAYEINVLQDKVEEKDLNQDYDTTFIEEKTKFPVKIAQIAREATDYLQTNITQSENSAFSCTIKSNIQLMAKLNHTFTQADDAHYLLTGVKALTQSCENFTDFYDGNDAAYSNSDSPILGMSSAVYILDNTALQDTLRRIPEHELSYLCNTSTTQHEIPALAIEAALGYYNAVLALKNACVSYLLNYWCYTAQYHNIQSTLPTEVEKMLQYDLMLHSFSSTNPVNSIIASPSFYSQERYPQVFSLLDKYRIYLYNKLNKGKADIKIQDVMHEEVYTVDALVSFYKQINAVSYMENIVDALSISKSN